MKSGRRASGPVALVILDGWGWREDRHANAVAMAATPNFDRYWLTCPHTLLKTSGLDVGLPCGVMGNSEVGHLNIGAGRVVYQDLTRIDRAIADGHFAAAPALQAALAHAREGGHALHLVGLLSDGGVHSHIDHLFALLDAARAAGVARVYVHPMLDGRDTSPTGGLGYLRALQEKCVAVGNAQIATIGGRYYGMDRDRRWERTQLAFDAMVHGRGEAIVDPLAALQASYDAGVTDEFVIPKVVVYDGKPVGAISRGDTVLFFNFRGDRARQICRALGAADFAEFPRGDFVPVALTGMTRYHQDFPYPSIFPPVSMTHLLGDVVSAAGLSQLRIAETEKYAHVTFFFNGGREDPSPGEARCLIQSPKDVPTYDHKPEMSVREVTRVLLERIATQRDDVIILNFANADMVGHTGNIPAAVRAVETVDACLGATVEALTAMNGAALVTADHGNAEEMQTADGQPHTAHTTNPVPCFLAGVADGHLRDGGRLADLAPTLLALLGLPQPAEMTGESLLAK